MEMPSQNTRLASGRHRPSLTSTTATGESEDQQGNEAGTTRPAGGGFIRRFGTPESREATDPDPGDSDGDAASES